MLKHKQVIFMTLNGDLVTVDTGLQPLLVILKRLGVETLYSCQGTEEVGGYICATTKTFLPVLRRIKDQPIWVKSLDVLVQKFKSGHREIVISHFHNDRWLKLSYHRGKWHINGFSLERTWSLRHGSRVIIRFPSKDLSTLTRLFESIS